MVGVETSQVQNAGKVVVQLRDRKGGDCILKVGYCPVGHGNIGEGRQNKRVVGQLLCGCGFDISRPAGLTCSV